MAGAEYLSHRWTSTWGVGDAFTDSRQRHWSLGKSILLHRHVFGKYVPLFIVLLIMFAFEKFSVGTSLPYDSRVPDHHQLWWSLQAWSIISVTVNNSISAMYCVLIQRNKKEVGGPKQPQLRKGSALSLAVSGFVTGLTSSMRR